MSAVDREVVDSNNLHSGRGQEDSMYNKCLYKFFAITSKSALHKKSSGLYGSLFRDIVGHRYIRSISKHCLSVFPQIHTQEGMG